MGLVVFSFFFFFWGGGGVGGVGGGRRGEGGGVGGGMSVAAHCGTLFMYCPVLCLIVVFGESCLALGLPRWEKGS